MRESCSLIPKDLLKRGKRLRPRLFFLCQGLFGPPSPASVPVAVMLELVHAASLIHDDIIDESDQRRGQATLNKLYGSHVSVLTGDYLLAMALRLGSDYDRFRVMAEVSQTLLAMTQSELVKAIRPIEDRLSPAHYEACAAGKTGSLMASACVLGGRMQTVSAETEAALRQFGHAFGQAFQIQDDILDFSGSAYSMGKPVGQDDGKQCTLPLILAFEEASPVQQKDFLAALNEASDTRYLHDFIDTHGGLELAIGRRDACAREARMILAQWPDSIYREGLENWIGFNQIRER